MIKQIITGTVVLLLIGALAGAAAQEAIIAGEKKMPEPIGRYTMTPAPNGFLRLDTRTGAVSLCTVTSGQVRCQSSADERAALEAEIARLSKKVTALESKLAQSASPLAKRLRNAMPSDAEMDKALSLAERFLRRMMRVIREENPKQDRT